MKAYPYSFSSIFCVLSLVAASSHSVAADPFVAGDENGSAVFDFTESHCLGCHSGDAPAGGFGFDALNLDLSDLETARRWVSVHDRVVSGEMPPAGETQPDSKQSDEFVKLLADRIKTA
ncbi:MAG: hypothetical protein KDB00_20405, partial [Planctomycetales bacterium]|nr:hypothetical protein [Planctomycetales bacterium]